jgi:hypothetical protein
MKPIVDLRPMAESLHDVLWVEAIRPSRQAAGALDLGLLQQSHEEVLRKCRKCLVFDRHDVDEIVHSFHHYFPRDSLKDILESWERQNLRGSEHFRAKHPEQEGWQWLSAARENIALNLERSAAESRRLGFDPESIIRYQDCIRKLEYYGQFLRTLKYWLELLKDVKATASEDYAKAIRPLENIWSKQDIRGIVKLNNDWKY